MKTLSYRTIPFILLTIVSLCSGCATVHPKPDHAISDPSQLISHIKNRSKSLKSARFPEIVLEYYGGDQRIKVRQLFLVQRPDAIRVQTRVPASNEILSLLVSKDGEFAMHDRRENKFFHGRATPDNISRLLPVELSPADLVEIMYGGAPWEKFTTQAAGPARVGWDSSKGLYTYEEDTEQGGKLTMWVDPTNYATREVSEFDVDGKEVWHYTTDKWTRIDEYDLPLYRRFTMPARSIDFSITYEKVHINPSLPDMLFELEAPEGSDIYEFQ